MELSRGRHLLKRPGPGENISAVIQPGPRIPDQVAAVELDGGLASEVRRQLARRVLGERLESECLGGDALVPEECHPAPVD